MSQVIHIKISLCGATAAHSIGRLLPGYHGRSSRSGLWRPRRRRAKRVFQIRERRLGELIQVDGSHHDWFEGRGNCCALLVFIDDATGRPTGQMFAPAETTRSHLELLRHHILAHGVPPALYSDRHGIT